MDFMELAQLLMRLQEVDPNLRWHFDGDVLIIRRDIWTVAGTRQMFEDAQKMFEPID